MRSLCFFILLLLTSKFAVAGNNSASFSIPGRPQTVISTNKYLKAACRVPQTPVHFEMSQHRRLWVQTSHDVVMTEPSKSPVAQIFPTLSDQQIEERCRQSNQLDHIYPFHNFW